MKKILALIILAVVFMVLIKNTLVKAQDCSNPNQSQSCQSAIDQLGADINNLNNDLKNKTTSYQNMLQQLDDIKAKIIILGQNIQKGEEALMYQKQLLNARVKSYYKNITGSSLSVVDFLISDNLSESLNRFFYQKTAVDEDKKTIIKVVLYIKNLEDEKTRLAVLKEEVNKQSQLLAGQIEETKQKIAELSARQQQLIAQKLASLNISRSAASMGRCDSDLTNGRDPGFGPKFGFFTYGVPNRVGMNQWGAYGRAKAGQSYDQILRAYYNFDSYQNFDNSIHINVDGYGSFSLEDYVKRIYEVPDDWGSSGGMEALKAQAIAARSYALAYTNKGTGSICSSEQCQVFQPQDKGGNWDAAVDATQGKVMVQGGNPIKAWFSSTHGGYIFSSSDVGWSGTSWTKHGNDFDGSVGSFSDLQSKAYDKGSPWFYCDWGSRAQYNKTAWLKPEEVADIVNVILLARSDSSTTEHLYQIDSPPAGVDIWGVDRVKQELQNRHITPYNHIDNIVVNADFGYGKVTNVNVSGDGGSASFDGSEFKNWFNLRAPANIQIVGPLYNVEKR